MQSDPDGSLGRAMEMSGHTDRIKRLEAENDRLRAMVANTQAQVDAAEKLLEMERGKIARAEALRMEDKRDWFAGQALAGILGGHFGDTVPHVDVGGGSEAAAFAYQYADAMLKERG